MMKKVVVASIMTAVVLMLTFTLVLPTDGEGADNYTDVTDTDPIEATLNESHIEYECVKADEIIYTLDETSHTATVVNPSEHPQAELPYSTYSGEITIPSKIKYIDQEYDVTSIGLQAFCQSPNIGGGPTTVILPEGLTTISEKAFENCTNLFSITLPSTLTTIGEGAFYGCSELNKLTIPAGVTDLGFIYMPNVDEKLHANLSFGALNGWLKTSNDWSKLKFDESSPFKFGQENGVLYKIVNTEKELVYLIDETTTTFTVGSDVTSIGTGAFYDKTNLASISFENESALKTIGSGAFAFTKISEITLPSTISSLGPYTFDRCSSLNSLSLPANIDLSTSDSRSSMGALNGWLDNTKALKLDEGTRYSVYGGALYDDTILLKVFDNSISEFTLKKGTTSIRDDAFSNLEKLNKATIEMDHITSYDAIAKLCELTNGNIIILGDENYQIEDGVLYNGTVLISVFDKDVSQVFIHDGTTEIRKEAFKNTNGLSTVVIPSSVTTIGERAFQNSFISGLYIPRSVQTIGNDAFAGMTSILIFEGDLPNYSETTNNEEETSESYLFVHPSNLCDQISSKWSVGKDRVRSLDSYPSVTIEGWSEENFTFGEITITISGGVPETIVKGESASFTIPYENQHLMIVPSFMLIPGCDISDDGMFIDPNGIISIGIYEGGQITVKGLATGTCKCALWALILMNIDPESEEIDKNLAGYFGVIDLNVTVGNRTIVNFDLNGVSGEIESINTVSGSTIIMPSIPETVTNLGYSFDSWNDKNDGTGIKYATGDKLVVQNDVTLYAQWSANTYTIKFNANGGIGSMGDLAMTYGTAEDLPANVFTRSGYTFSGWNTVADGSGTPYADKASVNNLVSTNNGEVTLYAQWTRNYVPPSGGGGGTTTPPKDTTIIDKNPDGSSTETKTENKTNSDGSKTETITVTEKDKDGNTTGSSQTETTTSTKKENGSTITSESTTTTKKDADGNVTGSTTSSTTKTESSTTTTIVEKEEVKDADDNVTSSTEKTTETVKIDGGTLVSEKTEVTDASGNVTTTENIKAESKDGTVKTTVESDDSATTVSTVITTFGKVDDRIIDMAIAQSDAVSDKVSEDSHSKVIQIDTGSDSSSAEVSLSPESLSAIAEKGAEFKVVCKTGTMQLDKDVIGTLTNPKKDVTVTMYEPTDSDLTEAQVSAKGDRFGVSMHAVVGEDRYHMLGGKVTVTIPYVIDAYSDSDYGIFYIDEQGMRTFMNSVYDEVTKAFIFETDHFSLFVVDEVPAPAEDSDNTLLYVGIVVVLIVVIAVAAFLIRKH